MKLFLLAFCVGVASAATAFGRSPTPVRRVQAPASIPFQAPVVQHVEAVARSSVQGYKSDDVNAPILRSDSDVRPDGYSYNYETGNGISAEAVGSLKRVDDFDVITAQGRYSYTAADGTPVSLSYVADENGYQPQSDLLPVGPPIPEAILRSLEYIAAHPPKN